MVKRTGSLLIQKKSTIQPEELDARRKFQDEINEDLTNTTQPQPADLPLDAENRMLNTSGTQPPSRSVKNQVKRHEVA